MQKQNYELQKLAITNIKPLNKNTNVYTLSSIEGGAVSPLKAGQYLSLFGKIGETFASRPYSVCSSPMDAENGFYQLAIEQYPGGFFPNFVHDSFKLGDEVCVRGPVGEFCYDNEIDTEQVVFISGGSAITPFLSMMKAVDEGSENFCVTLLFGSTTKDEILFLDELDRLSSNPKINIVHVLSDECCEGYEHGYISAELIKKYIPKQEYSLFICGPCAMYSFVDPEIEKLGIKQELYHHEGYAVPRNLNERADYGFDMGAVHVLTVIDSHSEAVIEIPCRADETILVTLERAGISARSLCRSGECDFCKTQLISGSVYIPQTGGNDKRKDLISGIIHPCYTFATSDLTIRV